MTTAAPVEELQAGFIIMTDHNPYDLLSWSGRLFKREKKYSIGVWTLKYVCVRLFRFPDDGQCQGILRVWPQALQWNMNDIFIPGKK